MTIEAEVYYHKTAGALNRPRLSDNLQADVCIVGAGLAGLTAALELLDAGKSVLILEAECVAFGASGRNGGFVSPGWATGHAHIARMAGMDVAKKLHALSIEGVGMVAANIADLAIDDARPVYGALSVARQPDRQAAMDKQKWLGDEFEYDIEFVPKEKLRQWLDTRSYFHALLDKHAFHFHPVHYAQGLARQVLRLGGMIFEHSRALSIKGEKGNYQITSHAGKVKADQVIICCGGYTDKLIPKLAASYVPISTYVALSESRKDMVETAIKCPYAIGDARRASDYYRLLEDGQRILWGGMITTQQREPHDLAKLLKRRMVDTYPQLAKLDIELAWSGRMAYARHLMPQIGELAKGLWYCTAFGGHGMNTTAIGSRVVAEGVAGISERYKLFAPFGLVWNGASFGKAAVQLTYWYYRFDDWWREKRALSRVKS